jgi:hypothetical protein
MFYIACQRLSWITYSQAHSASPDAPFSGFNQPVHCRFSINIMHTTILLTSTLAFLSANAIPTELIFGRSVGDICRGDEGTGTCQSTSSCKGISYPKGCKVTPILYPRTVYADLCIDCPEDPYDIQVRIPCLLTHASSRA